MTHYSPTVTLARQLIVRESVTPEDAGCQQLMIECLQQLGFHVTPLASNGVKNFWAVHGSDGPLLAFAGHTDVVPTGNPDAWRYPPFSAKVVDGMLYGRGAADMKGSLAAMITACEAFISRHPEHPGRIAFLITSDEEGPATDGTIKVVEYLHEQGEHIDWCVVGEPSSSAHLGDVIKNGRRGSLNAVMTVQGQQGHVAYPHLADNPIHAAAPALAELAATQWDSGNAYFPATSFQISNIHSGTGATNVIPGELTVVFNFRFSTELTATAIKTRVESILDAHGLTYSIDWNLSGEPFLTPAGALVDAARDAVMAVTGNEAQLSTSGGTSDGRFIAPGGTQVVELGPCNATIHKVDECVSIKDLDQLAEVYQQLLINLLGEKDEK
jgi:succinyl-diaminopimelate desuccinylase